MGWQRFCGQTPVLVWRSLHRRLGGCDIYRIKDRIETAKEWQVATVLNTSLGHALALYFWLDGRMLPMDINPRQRAAEWVTSVVRHPSFLRVPCHILRWSSRFTRKTAKSSLEGEVYASS